MVTEGREDLMNAAEAARALGISRTRVLELAQAGRMGKRFGPYYLFTPEEIEAYRVARTQNKGGRPKSEGLAETQLTTSPILQTA
jgi:hypothetical protein